MQNESTTPVSSNPDMSLKRKEQALKRKEQALQRIKNLIDGICWVDSSRDIYSQTKELVEAITCGEHTLTQEEFEQFLTTLN